MNTVVIGVVFMDIKGFPFGKYDRRGTNLGSIMMTHGGVARNVAENLANLGSGVSFISMFDKDAMGQEAKKRLLDAGVCLDYAVETPEKGMGMWLAVFNEKGDLDGSVSHIPSTRFSRSIIFLVYSVPPQNCSSSYSQIRYPSNPLSFTTGRISSYGMLASFPSSPR